TETAVTILQARGEPAGMERLLGDVLVGLDRAGQLARLVGVAPQADRDGGGPNNADSGESGGTGTGARDAGIRSPRVGGVRARDPVDRGPVHLPAQEPEHRLPSGRHGRSSTRE